VTAVKTAAKNTALTTGCRDGLCVMGFTQRLAKQVSKKFRLVRSFKELEQALLVCWCAVADRVEWNGKQNVQFVHNLVNTIL